MAGRVHPSTVHRREPSLCIQYTLFLLNVVFCVAGVILILAGVYVIVESKQHVHYKELADLSFQPSLFLLLIGVLIYVITSIGCIGALRQNNTLLRAYVVIIVAMLLLMIAAAVLGFAVFKDKLEVKVREKLKSAIGHYRDPKRLDLQNLIDGLQTELQCCGIESYKDWNNNVYFNCSSPGVESCGVPYSCCKQPLQLNRQCGYGVQLSSIAHRMKTIHTHGCVKRVSVWLSANFGFLFLGGMSISIVVLQLLSIFLAIVLLNQIQEVKRHF